MTESEPSRLHQQLWAPWRLSYVKTSDEARKIKGCFLCHYRDADRDQDTENLVVERGASTITVLNRFPYNNGHLLVSPLNHKASFDELNETELLECMQQLQRLTSKMSKILRPDGFNIGLNLGSAAGAGLPGHLHWHLVPRWNGDTNFMSVITDAKVIPQSLEALYALLQDD
jgi:ATP adenylyltransferase